MPDRIAAAWLGGRKGGFPEVGAAMTNLMWTTSGGTERTAKEPSSVDEFAPAAEVEPVELKKT